MDWLTYFRECVAAAPFTPWPFDGEDKNLLAFASREAFAEWYGQEPGALGQPYRDDAFYVRELTNISMRYRPKRIVELGTCHGIGTVLLAMLNPGAEIVTVDNRLTQYRPGNVECETGFLAKMQNYPNVRFVTGCSWEFKWSDVDFCFVDADHSYGGVWADTNRAWRNKSSRGVIAWHDYNERHPGVRAAVDEFCRQEGHLILNKKPDSATVWVETNQ